MPSDFERAYRERVEVLFDRELKTMPGVTDMLRLLRGPVYVASSGPLHKMRLALKTAGIASFFGDQLYSSYEVGSWKPEPGLFPHAASSMGFAPEYCVVVEDSEVGVQAACATGIPAFQYLPDDGAAAHPRGVPFADMVDLPELLARLDA